MDAVFGRVGPPEADAGLTAMNVPDIVWFAAVATAAMIGWRIYGARVRQALDRFDQSRIDADRQLIADTMNPLAHFRRSLEAINDQVPPVKLVMAEGQDARVPVWNDQTYETIQDAEDARWRHVVSQARSFYQELDEDFGLRVAGPAPNTARNE